MKKSSSTRRISLFFFIFSIGCVITFIVLDLLFFSFNIKTRMMDNAIQIALQKEHDLEKFVEKSKNTLHSISSSNPFKQYIKNPAKHVDNMNDIFFVLTQNDKSIMQLRFLDEKGMEKIRIDRKTLDQTPIVISQNGLQDKSSRYYFSHSKEKAQTVWYSNIDLNVEHGKVETPFKPTFRAMLPLKENGKFLGVLIVNYYMQDILQELSTVNSHDVMIVDENAYALIHFYEEKNWGYYKKNQETIQSDFPYQLNTILGTKNLLQQKDFIVKKINIETPTKLFFILKLKDLYLNELYYERLIHYLLVGFALFVLSIMMSTVFSKYLKKVFIVLNDIKSLNKMLNKKVKKQTEELVKSKQQLDDILTTISDFVWEVNEKGEYTYLSPQVKTILGYEVEELLGKTPFDVMPQEESFLVKQQFEKCVEEKKPIVQLINQNLHKSGHIVYLETSGNPIFENNILIGYRGSDRDITLKINSQKIINENYKKIEELNEELKSKVKEEVEKNQQKDMQLFAQSKMAAMGDMIANIAHQWRQPLSAISTVASGIKIKQEYHQLEEKDLAKDMDIIVDRTKYLSDTIETFMNFLKDKKDFKEVSIKHTINKAIQMVESSMQSNFIRISNNFSQFDDFLIYTVPSELQEVIINILNNAKDALKDKVDIDKKVDITILENETQYIIKIEDNGGGIPREIIDRIFEPYFTTKHASQGTGLGLHMSYRVITESLKGKIYVQNGLEGAIFMLELPR